MATWLWFAKLILKKPKDYWNNVLWIDKTKAKKFAQKPNTAYQHKYCIPSVKHSGGDGVMIWARCAATGTGYLEDIELTINSSVYQSAWALNMRHFVQHLKLGWSQVMQQYSDVKHKSATEWLENKRIKVLQSPKVKNWNAVMAP